MCSPITWKSSSENSGVLWQLMHPALPMKSLQALLGVLADRVPIAGDVAVERRIPAHQLSQIRFDRFAVVHQDAVDDFLVAGADRPFQLAASV